MGNIVIESVKPVRLGILIDEHDNPPMATAHKRPVRGHLHAMGLGLATILISLHPCLYDGKRQGKGRSLGINMHRCCHIPICMDCDGSSDAFPGARARRGGSTLYRGPRSRARPARCLHLDRIYFKRRIQTVLNNLSGDTILRRARCNKQGSKENGTANGTSIKKFNL